MTFLETIVSLAPLSNSIFIVFKREFLIFPSLFLIIPKVIGLNGIVDFGDLGWPARSDLIVKSSFSAKQFLLIYLVGAVLEATCARYF